MTFDAPGLPDPNVAMSTPLARAIRIALGNVPSTYADVSELQKTVGYKPSTPVRAGVQRFVDWYMAYYETVPA